MNAVAGFATAGQGGRAMADDMERFREWDRRQWASAMREREAAGNAEASGAELRAQARWNKGQWVGEDRLGRRPAPKTPTEMLEGEPGISGNRRNPGVQDWASASSNLLRGSKP
jgi:hypothetical protein